MQKKSLYVMATLAWSVAFYVVFSGFTYHADFKMGYVITVRVFEEYQPMIDANKEIELKSQELEKQAQAMNDVINTKIQEYDSKNLMWSETKKTEAGNEIIDLRDKLTQFYQENLDPASGKIRQEWDAMTQPILDNVQDIIDRIGTEEGYDVIFDVKEGFVLFAKEEHDMTDHVLEELKNSKF